MKVIKLSDMKFSPLISSHARIIAEKSVFSVQITHAITGNIFKIE